MANHLKKTKLTRKPVKPRHNDKPLSLYPWPFEDAVEVLLHTPPIKETKKKPHKRKEKVEA
jgi:hypothetical protein